MAIYLGNNMIGVNSIFSSGQSGSNQGSSSNTPNIIVNSVSITANGVYTAPTGTAYSPVTVNVPAILVPVALRPDATIIKTYSEDINYMDTTRTYELPSATYSTATQVLITSACLASISVCHNNYDYYVAERMLTIPSYNEGTSIAKGRIEYQLSSYLYAILDIPAGTQKAFVNTSSYGTRTYPVVGQGIIQTLYWQSASTLGVYNATTYGLNQVVAAPTTNASVLVPKRPALQMRGSTTFTPETFFKAIKDIRRQYIIEVYQAPKNNLNIDGWGANQQLSTIFNCINAPSHTLT